MKKFALLITILLVVWGSYFYFKNPPTKAVYLPNPQVPEEIIRAPGPEEKIKHIIENLNDKNKLVQTVHYRDLSITVSSKMGKVRVDGWLGHEKGKKFRMIMNSFLGRELDIGSNENRFWFWSRQMDPPALFYADHENLMRTRLKTPFNPVWMMESLGVSRIETEDVKLMRYNQWYVVAEQRVSTLGEDITKITLVSEDGSRISGHYIYDSKNNVEVSSEVLAYHEINGCFIPKKIRTIWHKEQIVLIWNLNRPYVNLKLNPSNWTMPNHRRRIDLSTYRRTTMQY